MVTDDAPPITVPDAAPSAEAMMIRRGVNDKWRVTLWSERTPSPQLTRPS
jgi:hypothetical protein